MKKMDELMNEYKFSQEYTLESNELSEDEKKQILNLTLQKSGIGVSSDNSNLENSKMIKRKTGISKKRIVAFALAATLCLGTIIASATGYFQMSEIWRSIFSFSDNESATSVAGQEIDVQVVNDGWTLDIKEAIGDSRSVYVLYDMIAPEGTILNEESYSFKKQMLNVKDAPPQGASWHSSELEDSNPNDNIKSFVFCGSTNNEINDKTIELTLGEFSEYSIAKGDYTTLIDKDFKATFKLNYPKASEIVKINKPVSVFGGTSELVSVEISPLSAIFEMKGGSVKEYDLYPPKISKEGRSEEGEFVNTIELIYKDGSKVSQNSSASTMIDGNKFTVILNYNSFIDKDNIKEMKIGGTVVSMKE